MKSKDDFKVWGRPRSVNSENGNLPWNEMLWIHSTDCIYQMQMDQSIIVLYYIGLD